MGPLEKRFDKLLVFAAISTQCDQATAERIERGEPEAIVQYYRACERWIDIALARTLSMCGGSLKPTQSWQALSKRPQDFNKALDKLLRGMSSALKLLYRMPDHRPSENEARNRELFELKTEHPDWSFGQIAFHYSRSYPGQPMTDKIAERGYKLHLEGLRNRLQRAMKARDVRLQTRSLSPEQLEHELPSPDYILAILTGSD